MQHVISLIRQFGFGKYNACLSSTKEHTKAFVIPFFQCLKIKNPCISTFLSFTAFKNNFPYTQELMHISGFDFLAD